MDWNYDEFFTRSLALEEASGGFDAESFGGFVSCGKEMDDLIIAPYSTDGTALRINIVPKDEGDSPRDVATRVTAATGDSGTTHPAQDTPAGDTRRLDGDGASVSDTKSYASVGLNMADLEDSATVTSQLEG